MGLCRDCKYWEPGEGYFCPSTRGYCNQPTGGDNQPVKPINGAAGHGEPAEPGRLKTGPLFGCNTFVSRIKIESPNQMPASSVRPYELNEEDGTLYAYCDFGGVARDWPKTLTINGQTFKFKGQRPIPIPMAAQWAGHALYHRVEA